MQELYGSSIEDALELEFDTMYDGDTFAATRLVFARPAEDDPEDDDGVDDDEDVDFDDGFDDEDDLDDDDDEDDDDVDHDDRGDRPHRGPGDKPPRPGRRG